MCIRDRLSECARQMKYVLSRDDLMLKDSEYDALERASVIIAGLAAFQVGEQLRIKEHNF